MRAAGLAGLAAVLAVALSAAPALAQDLPRDGMTASEVAAWLTRSGNPAQVAPDTTTPGDQIVSTVIDGMDVDIYLYQCAGEGDARRCKSIQYATGWAPKAGLTVEKANAWNSSSRYVKAYITPKGSLFGEYDLDVSPGGTLEMLDDSLDNWRGMLTEFKNFFGA
jgi:hypothetical protein